MHTILSAGIKDLKDLNRLERVCFVEDRWPIWDLIAVLTVPGVMRLKAVNDEGKMLGFIAGDLRESKRIAWIVTLGVFPEYRRLKIASELLSECEKRLQRDCIRLCVRRSNTSAIALYLAQGYLQVDAWKDYYYGGEDALVLEKRSV